MGMWISFKFIQKISDIDNSNILSLRRKQLKPGTPFFTEAKLTMESILFIYEVSKSAFVQADFGIFFVREFVRMDEIDREFTNTMSFIFRQRRNLQRKGVKIEKFVCEVRNSWIRLILNSWDDKNHVHEIVKYTLASWFINS